ncbi:MAG TPA: YidC/Oxa1 family membrane protein insertase [Candidatus Saccharimonadales bacterium]
MFTTFVVQPIFNLLVLIYTLLPGHNFGLAIIIFTVVVRLLLYPLVKKQLHHVKAMRKMQPELKAIKKKAAGNRQKEQMMVLELYKERGISPFGPILILIPQLIILIGLYVGLNRVINDPQQIVSFAYPVLQDTGWMKELASNIGNFDETLLGIVDLTRSATGDKGLYWPAFIIVALTAVVQYYQSKQVLPNNKDARKLRDILRAAGEGEQADQAEVQAAVSRSTLFLLPAIVFVVTLGLPSALGLYWLVGGIVAIIQQSLILREDEEELEALANAPDKKRDVKKIPEAEVVSTPPKTKNKKSSSNKKKRRKK